MTKSLFIPHGRYRFQWYGEVLYVQWIGTFNFEAMSAYMAEHKRQVETAAPPQWGRIVDLREWEGITPDAVSKFDELAQWLETTRCVASAQVFSDRFYQTIAAKVADSVGPHNLKQVFSMADAVTFLTTHGLSIQGDPGIGT